jgi:hypothetical protein
MIKNDSSKLQNFTEFLIKNPNDIYSKNKDITGIFNYFRNFSTELNKLKYFEFIPKDSTYTSKSRLRLAIEMKSLLNYYTFQSFIFGINFLYFFLIFKRSTNVIGISSILSINSATLITFYLLKIKFQEIFKIMDVIYKDEVIFLNNKLKRKESGFNEEVSK